MDDSTFLFPSSPGGSAPLASQMGSISYYLVVATGVITLSSGTNTSPDEGQLHPWPLNLYPCAHISEARAETHPLSCRPPMPSFSVSNFECSQQPRHENFTFNCEDLTVVPPDSLRRTTFPWSNLLTLNTFVPLAPESRGFELESFPSDQIATNNEKLYVYHADVDTTTTGWHEEEEVLDATLGQSHHYELSDGHFMSSTFQLNSASHFYILPEALPQDEVPLASVSTSTPDFSTTSSLLEIFCTSHAAPYQDKDSVTPQSHPRPFMQVSKEPVAASLDQDTTPIGQPAGASETIRGRYSCKICDQEFAQPQGLSRHRREKHEPKLCLHCHAFKWGRPYLFKKHLEKDHPDIKPEEALEKGTGAHRRGTRSRARRRRASLSLPESSRRYSTP